MKKNTLIVSAFVCSIIISLFILFSSCQPEASHLPADQSAGKGGSLARFTIIGEYLYLVESDSLKAIHIIEPASPVMRSSQYLGSSDIETIFPFNDLLFIGSQSGMYIYSLRDPAQPSFEGLAQHIMGCDPVVANDSIAFVTLRNGSDCNGTLNELQIYDIQDIRHPRMIHTITLSGPFGLGLNGNILYVCDNDNGLVVIDVRNPREAYVKKTIAGFNFRDCIPYNDILLCMTDKGMVIYNITDPETPEFVTEL